MRRQTFITILLTLFCLGLAMSSVHAAVGDIIRTIPSPIPASGDNLSGATYAEGMLIVIEKNNTPGLPSKFHKIDPLDGTILDTIDFPFNGFPSSISYDGSSLWVCRWYTERRMFQVGLDGSLISSFKLDLWPYFRAQSVNCEGDYLWVGANGDQGYPWTRLFKMTKFGDVIEWYSTTGIIEMVSGAGEIDTNYPSGSNLFLVDSKTQSVKRLSVAGGTVTVEDEFDSPSDPDEYTGGLAFDGENLWLNAVYPKQGKIWCLSDGSAEQADFKIKQKVNGGYNPWIKGQTFTPSIGIDPDPGAVSTLDLKAITFYRSHQDWSGPTSHFYLNIYDGDPVNGSGTFVGSSENSVDVSLLENFSPMVWLFDHLALDYHHEYWALVSSTNISGGLDVWCGMRECGPDNYPGGNAIAGTSGDPGGFTVKGNDLTFEIGLNQFSTLTADVETLNESAGTVNFEIDAGSEFGGRTYLLAVSISGTVPGTVLPGGMVLPVNWDFATDLCIAYNNVIWFYDFWGALDAEGKASPRFEWPGFTGSAGLAFYFAACAAMPYDFVTNAWTVTITP